MRKLRKTVLKSVLSIILMIAMILGAVPLDGLVLETRADGADYQYKLTFYYEGYSAANQKYEETNESTIELSDVIYDLDNYTEGIPYEYDSDMFIKANTTIEVSDPNVLTIDYDTDYWNNIVIHKSFTGTEWIKLRYTKNGNTTEYKINVSYDGPETLGEYTVSDQFGNTKTVLAQALTGNESSINGGWYIATKDLTYSNGINISGVDSSVTTRLIIADGATITTGSITGSDIENTDFSIYKQGENATGKIIVNGSICGFWYLKTYGVDLTVKQGIDVKNLDIFKGEHDISNPMGHAVSCSSFEMEGGKLTATGGSNGYGIYAPAPEGSAIGSGKVKFKGGQLTATGGAGGILASNRPQSDTDFRKNEGIILEYNAETDSFCASSYTGKVFLFGEYLIDGIKYGVTNGWKMLSGTQNAAVAGKTIVTIWTGYSITPVGDDSQYITVKLESGASYVDEGVTYYKYDSEVTFGYEREGYKGIKYTLTNGEDSSYTGGPGAVFRTFAKI